MDAASHKESDDDVMTVVEVAEYLRLLPNTIYAALARKELPHMRIGGSIRISRRVVTEFLRGQGAAKA